MGVPTRALGAAANALGVACIVIALARRETGTAVLFGAVDREGVAIDQPDIVPWLVAAIVLTVVGTLLLLRRACRRGR